MDADNLSPGSLALIKEHCCDPSSKDVIGVVEKGGKDVLDAIERTERSIKEAIGLTREAAKEAEDAARQSGAAVNEAVKKPGFLNYIIKESAVGKTAQQSGLVSLWTLILIIAGYLAGYYNNGTSWDLIAIAQSYF